MAERKYKKGGICQRMCGAIRQGDSGQEFLDSRTMARTRAMAEVRLASLDEDDPATPALHPFVRWGFFEVKELNE